jgi:hypothetical protein
LVSTAVTVAVLAVVFAGLFPKVADYSEAWSSIRRLPIGYLIALVVATVVNLAVYVWPLQVALGPSTARPGSPPAAARMALFLEVPTPGRLAEPSGRRRHGPVREALPQRDQAPGGRRPLRLCVAPSRFSELS